MSQFVRIKHYIINLESLTYVRVREEHIDFGFAFPTEKQGGRSFVRITKGTDVTEAEFGEVREFVLRLPDPDRVIVV